jgi:MFS family permease
MAENGLGRTGWASLGDLTPYHWFVFVVAALGWLADCMDQQLFVLSRREAITELLGSGATDGDITYYSTIATSIFLIGWATGGIVFGIMGDLYGRVRTMLLTILLYSVFTGLSSFSLGVWDFSLFRFLTGLGVGGEFAVGVALLAETMPDRARPYTLGLLQATSAVGNVTAALLYMGLGSLQSGGTFDNLRLWGWPVTPWRVLFVIGMLPALIALLVRRRLQEPERWKQAVKYVSLSGRFSTVGELFSIPRWRRHALLGLMLAFAGVVGLWAIAFFAPDLTQTVLKEGFRKHGYEGDELKGIVKIYASWAGLMTNVGAFFGMFAFSWVTGIIGRRWAFACSFLLAMLSTALVFGYMSQPSDIFWMMPLMGFCQLAIFGGYAIYLPELFPTRLRSTGTSFCYNVGRFVAAVGPVALGLLTQKVFNAANGFGNQGMRWAGITMCSVYVLGLLALPFLPETKGQPLPE